MYGDERNPGITSPGLAREAATECRAPSGAEVFSYLIQRWRSDVIGTYPQLLSATAKRCQIYLGLIAPAAGQFVSPILLRFISKKRTGSLSGTIRSPTSRKVPSLITAV